MTIDDPGIFSIPLESGLLPIIHCELDGAESRFALLDTGAEGSLISPSQADRMRCERRKMEPLVVSSLSANAEMDVYLRVPQVLLGLMKIRDPSLPVARLPLDLDCMLGNGVL
ncbi:MAG TPA: aspartyl protease family protein, partial [Planctomycetota bacterium]|nr:aspartyl protease family protein [Planctomycetota bacterium]